TPGIFGTTERLPQPPEPPSLRSAAPLPQGTLEWPSARSPELLPQSRLGRGSLEGRERKRLHLLRTVEGRPYTACDRLFRQYYRSRLRRSNTEFSGEAPSLALASSAATHCWA